jgi:L-seryl-tRNA(Ser) seleniumtransferase
MGGLGAASLPARAAKARTLEVSSSLYESIGVRPFINAKGTYTILSGSQSLPEVKKAMEEASRHYVHLDELMEAVGQRIAEITKADWGIVTGGCAAAATHVTAACIAGTDPEKMQRLPKLDGLKSEVIMPKYARNPYDHATRMLGVTVIEVDSEEELHAAFNSRTAMVLILSCPAAEKGPLSIENTSKVAKTHNVPVLVDAAAEVLTIPNIHLQHGATMVAYSGGKCLRGPQAAGLLLGRKDLVKAAWANAAPHHAYGRSLKVGKEEIMGMLAALEAWTRRDQDAEWKEWQSWLDYIKVRVTKVDGVTTEIVPPEDLSNHAPQLRLNWDGAKLGITGTEVAKTLAAGTPRIMVGDSSGRRGKDMKSSVLIMPYMMMPDDHKIVAESLFAVLSKPPKFADPVVPAGEPGAVDGIWNIHVQFAVGSAKHRVMFDQKQNQLTGLHETETLSNALAGEIRANEIEFRSAHPIQGTVLEYSFHGTVSGDTMSGEVGLGEYGIAKWHASRQQKA